MARTGADNLSAANHHRRDAKQQRVANFRVLWSILHNFDSIQVVLRSRNERQGVHINNKVILKLIV
jgi:hypothetical protein